MATDGVSPSTTSYPRRVNIDRPVYRQSDLIAEYQGSNQQHGPPLQTRCKRCFTQNCSPQCLLRTLPLLSSFSKYSWKNDLPNDIIAGLTVGVMHVPQGMAYGMLSSLGPVYGLYSSLFPVLVYFLLGTSNHISIGTSAITTLIVGAACDKGYAMLHDNNTNFPHLSIIHGSVDPLRLLLVLAITFSAGVIQLLMGVLKLGFIATYLSDSLISGFTTAAAFHVAASQLHHIFGVGVIQRHSGPLKLFYGLKDVFIQIPSANAVTIVMSLVAIILMLLVKILINNRCKSRLRVPIPIELIVLIIGTIVSYFINLNERYAVMVVGHIPRGIHAPIITDYSLARPLVGEIFSLAIVGFAVSISISKLYAKQFSYDIDANQELIAYGSSNLIGSFFSCFFTSGALARSAVQVSAGCRSRVTSLVSCIVIIIVLYAVGPLLHSLPNCLMAAIILVNLKGLFGQFFQLCPLWTASKYDMCVWIVTFLATLIVDIDWGLLAGVLMSFVVIYWRSQRARCVLLGRLRGSDIYKDVNRYSAAEEVPGVAIVQFGSSIFAANSDYFCTELYKTVGVNPHVKMGLSRCCKSPIKRRRHPVIVSHSLGDSDGHELTPKADSTVTFTGVNRYYSASSLFLDVPIRDIVLDFSLIAYVDKMGLDAVVQVIKEYEDIGVRVSLANVNDSVYDLLLTVTDISYTVNSATFVTVHDAVTHSQMNQPIKTNEKNNELDQSGSVDTG